MALTPRPPAYAWDWFARQRLLWREARARLATAQTPASGAYRAASAKSDVLALLKGDYDEDAVVRDVVDRVVAQLAFLDRTDVPFARLGATNPPRGMRWWWTALTGEDLDAVAPPRRRASTDDRQLTLGDVLEGYGDR